MKNLFIRNVSGIKFCSFLLVMFFVFSCSKEESPLTIADEPSDATLKSKVLVDGSIYLAGTSHFDVYAVKEQRVVVDGDLMFLLMTAELTHVGGQNYLLETEESLPLPDGSSMLYRKISFDVKITPGGVVMFSWPETWWELGTVRADVIGQLLDHTGCIPHGSGVNKGTLNYKGYFDGDKFRVSTHFMGEQVNPEPEMPDYWNIDGPAKFEFSFNLTKVD